MHMIDLSKKQVHDEIGKKMVQNLWNGYNTSLFTFGESKSGKSWTLFGAGINKGTSVTAFLRTKRDTHLGNLAMYLSIGIVPQTLTDLFKGVREKEKSFQQNGSTLEVRLNMAAIYNERVKDLLPATASAPTTNNSTKAKNSMKIREHSKKGYYGKYVCIRIRNGIVSLIFTTK